jgi:hypothetical protein
LYQKEPGEGNDRWDMSWRQQGSGNRCPTKEMRNFLISLAAVLLGNAVYFGIMPYLPPAAQHRAYQFDLGLVIDFWLCLVFFGLLHLLARRRERQRSAGS